MIRSGAASIPAFFFFALAAVGTAQAPTGNIPSTLTLSSSTKIEVAAVRPLWSTSAAAGSQLYAKTTFPVVADGHVVIPPGTYVAGTIEKLTRPTWHSNRAEIEVLFTQIIFANGYVVSLPALPSTATTASPANAPTLINVSVQVSSSDDVLLDNGAPIEITLAAPLALNAQQVAAAEPLSHAPVPGDFKSASLCRPIPGSPGTPGTPGTVIPGTPGTPSTVIPGGPGMPPTVIPGTPGTPDTVIPGTPGTPGFPGRSCPAPPMVISSTPVNIPANTSTPVNAPPNANSSSSQTPPPAATR